MDFKSITALADSGISQSALEKLADADAFRSLGFDRRQALWEVSALADNPAGIYKGQSAAKASEQDIQLPLMSLSEHVLQDYSSMALSLKAHPVSFVREKLKQMKVLAADELKNMKDGMHVRVAGLVLVRQRPGTASGICFITIEDETGNANLVVFQKLFDQYRKEIIRSKLLMVEGKLQIEGEVIHVVVKHCYNLSGLLQQLSDTENSDPPVQTLARADETNDALVNSKNRDVRVKKVIQAEIFPGGRNFR